MKIPLLCTILIFISLACVSSDNRNVLQTPGNSNSPVAAASPDLSTEKDKEEKSFTFPVQGGDEVTGHVYPDKEKPNGKMIIFTPMLDKTDGNLYNASLHSLWSVYGKNRGLFQLEDAKTEMDSNLGGNAICWEVFNPNQKFCVFPIKDSETGKIGALRVWLK
ncbi:MAG: hypothetical protein WA584_23235 [Pyrinomonadaceae bacterium]